MDMSEASLLRKMRELKARHRDLMAIPPSWRNDQNQNQWQQDVLVAVRAYCEGRIN